MRGFETMSKADVVPTSTIAHAVDRCPYFALACSRVALIPAGTGRPAPRRPVAAAEETIVLHSDLVGQPGVLEYGVWIGIACAAEHSMQAIAEPFKARQKATGRVRVMFTGREEHQAPVPWLWQECALETRVND